MSLNGEKLWVRRIKTELDFYLNDMIWTTDHRLLATGYLMQLGGMNYYLFVL